ncbi:uncharacterized protein LOC111697110 [Eurytemora carolleeae]|uniref:uncharacterized protein LOC111697110 n=1 Tax=Eurytemora carolleeae TaxID=1294199 RepID=UPI000C77F043|nr:uncharacterized protein LOC111697110 [Eurytemora carolleeae]|eukprot:XP_023322767.1 uncharacterized protein LOC111697110 [Eurytemora affinis]
MHNALIHLMVSEQLKGTAHIAANHSRAVNEAAYLEFALESLKNFGAQSQSWLKFFFDSISPKKKKRLPHVSQVSEPEPHGPEVASDLGSVAPVVPQISVPVPHGPEVGCDLGPVVPVVPQVTRFILL